MQRSDATNRKTTVRSRQQQRNKKLPQLEHLEGLEPAPKVDTKIMEPRENLQAGFDVDTGEPVMDTIGTEGSRKMGWAGLLAGHNYPYRKDDHILLVNTPYLASNHTLPCGSRLIRVKVGLNFALSYSVHTNWGRRR